MACMVTNTGFCDRQKATNRENLGREAGEGAFPENHCHNYAVVANTVTVSQNLPGHSFPQDTFLLIIGGKVIYWANDRSLVERVYLPPTNAEYGTYCRWSVLCGCSLAGHCSKRRVQHLRALRMVG